MVCGCGCGGGGGGGGGGLRFTELWAIDGVIEQLLDQLQRSYVLAKPCSFHALQAAEEVVHIQATILHQDIAAQIHQPLRRGLASDAESMVVSQRL